MSVEDGCFVCLIRSLGWVNFYTLLIVCSYLYGARFSYISNNAMGGSWWRHQMETIFASLALCEGNSPVTGEFPSQRPVTRSFGVFFDLRLNKRLSKPLRRWWIEMPSRPLWRHCNDDNV